MAYERIPYTSFMWKFGTTSFRTKEFNYMIEKQLALLDQFWKVPENSNQGWEAKYKASDQRDIYEIKNRYYDYLVDNGFMIGNERDKKYKTAREKTSGLYDMGLINENHRLSEVGQYLLQLSRSMSYNDKTELGISQDSYLYLKQLLKLSQTIGDEVVRPLVVILYLLSELNFLSFDEFKYIVPLCTSKNNTSNLLQLIKNMRNGNGSIDEIIKEFLLSKDNYKKGLERFQSNPFTKDLLMSISMNRKSPEKYDKDYIPLYWLMHSVYIDKDYSKIMDLFNIISKFQSSISTKWKTVIFTENIKIKIQKNPIEYLQKLPEYATKNESGFKKWFFLTMHLFKTKATLEDYFDLNRRYLRLTNCFIFDDSVVKLDIVPKQFFNAAIIDLYKQAYQECNLLEENCLIESICPSLIYNEQEIIEGLNHDLGTSVSTIEDAYDEVEKIRYDRFKRMLHSRFTDDKLLKLLDDFDNRNDDNINSLVTNNADIPTIFEYILGIIWYKVSGETGKILDYFKLSLDTEFLPITHAAGGEADIVYEYNQTHDYPKHCLLLEATLADSTNQRRLEMEPVSRHLGNHLLRTKNYNSYCVFVTSFLHVNVIADFRGRKDSIYYNSQNYNEYIEGMKIIPLATNDLREIIKQHIHYSTLYCKFKVAHESTERFPQKWYENSVKF